MKLNFRILAALAALIAAFGASDTAAAERNDSTVLCVFGDSYVKNHRRPMTETWHCKAAAALGLKYVNLGRNGSCVSIDTKGFGPAMTKRVKTELPEKMDAILIIAGHNDASRITEDAGLVTFEESLNAIFDEIKERYPKAKVGYVLPWHVDRGYFNQVIDIIGKVCKKRKIPVFDAEAAGGIEVNNDEFRHKYFQNKGVKDTAHLNAAGHDLIVGAGTDFLKKNLN